MQHHTRIKKGASKIYFDFLSLVMHHIIDECHSQESQTEYGGEAACSNGSVSHKRALTDSLTHLVDLEDTEQNEKDSLIRAYTWRTSSQR